VRRLHAEGWLGQKSRSGYYRYDGRKSVDDESALLLLQTLAAELGVFRRSGISNEEIVERLLYPMVNEGMRILDEGIAQRAGDIDIVWTAGYGFPDHRGGPMSMADGIGLRLIAERLRALREHGWRSSLLWGRLAAARPARKRDPAAGCLACWRNA
jgi:3-hydroxyacyl-CoA dehydrogenase